MRTVELLSPARDIAVGKAAIDNGADAVYIGAPAFGARKAAANSIGDIAVLVEYAHRFYCRVFVTLNTILYDSELAGAERMIRELYRIGVDALIVQDMGILRLDLPPICLHASTQMHNYDPERIRFLDRLGFRRIVLARELSLEQIRAVRREVKAELEVFIHGALCVSLSGQCYLSQHMFGRSANRGECAQPCRMRWSVEDGRGKLLVDNKYILSLKDLNLSASIAELAEAGVDSFKIEGRLKDENYVANVTGHYSSLIGRLPGIRRSGSGKVFSAFAAEPDRSFNRGYSSYFLKGRERGLVNPDTPKSMGRYIGEVAEVRGKRLRVAGREQLNNGDGLCCLKDGVLQGFRVNSAEGDWIVCNDLPDVRPGVRLYRNYDHRFAMQLEKNKSCRKIRIEMEAESDSGRLTLRCRDEDGRVAAVRSEEVFAKAENPLQRERLERQLKKCGDSDYVCESVSCGEGEILFVPAAAANALRRSLLAELDRVRAGSRPLLEPSTENRDVSYPLAGDWRLNVANGKAEAFYREHGVEHVEACFEKGDAGDRREVMRCRYCILYELGRCRKRNGNAGIVFPLHLFNGKHRFLLEFDCDACFMSLVRETGAPAGGNDRPGVSDVS